MPHTNTDGQGAASKHADAADEEQIVLIDEDGRRTGTAPKLASHHTETPLHLAFSCYLFDTDGRFLITRRSLAKKTWPGVWTNSLCGHMLPDEPLLDAVNRRLATELDSRIERADVVVASLRYRVTMPNGIVENELGPVLRILPSLPVRPMPEEVAEIRWTLWTDWTTAVGTESPEISPWSPIAIDRLTQLGPDPWKWPTADPSDLPIALRPPAVSPT